jgi:hypothetical protein
VHNIEGYAEECHVQTTSRRSVILGGASVAALTVGFPLCSFAEGSLTVDQFRTLSARLIGAGLPALDATAAGKLLDGFISMGRGPDLVVLAADPAVVSWRSCQLLDGRQVSLTASQSVLPIMQPTLSDCALACDTARSR